MKPGFLLLGLLVCLGSYSGTSNARERHDQAEVDHIYSLLAYAVVFKDWQTPQMQNPRGHNIGAVLVDNRLQPVFWARNANFASVNASQHAEIRLIYNYLQCSSGPALIGYTIYSTLEPCAMCTGMMSLTGVTRTVFGQEDPLYGNALERLAADHSKTGGDPPYPRLFKMELSPSPYASQLTEARSKSPDQNMVRWLRSEEARSIYAAAHTELLSLDAEELKSDTGRFAIDRARAFLEDVSSSYIERPETLCNATTP
ncbi:MAG: tRNA(adenine34) deaminase [Lysobacterales bacterium]|jgi:tRNA(adenine34) deaminase